LFTTNHKDIGILYLVTSFYFLIAGGVLAILVRLQLMLPELNLMSPSAFNQAVTVHGLVMVLWFLSPLAFALANYMVPLQIGARDLAFPRINAMSYWMYFLGGVLAAIGFFTPGGAIDTGWTVYAPLNTSRFSPQVGTTLGGAGLLMLIISVTMSTVNFMVTIFQMRARGLSLLNMPMYTWGILLTIFMMLLAFPSILAGVILLAAERLLGTVYFISVEGGAILWDHLFWFFGHPEVYIVLMPGLMALAEVIPVFSRRPLYGKKVLIYAAIIGSVMSFMVWAHHMFVTGIDPGFRKFMTISTESISIPFGVATLALIMTMWGGSVKMKTPMLFALGALALFIVGGIGGVFNSSVALDYYLRGTYWIVGHFHYTLVGGAVTGLLAALYYWWPKMTGRMYSEKIGRIHFVVYMVGFNILYMPIHLLIDMPRRVSTYTVDTGWGTLNLISTVGAVIFSLSWPILLINLASSLRTGAPAGNNPWKSWSLEWLTTSPPPRHNFEGIPEFRSDGTMTVVGAYANGGGLNEHESHHSRLPFLLSLSTFLILLGAGVGLPLALVGVILLAASIIWWARERFVAIKPVFAEMWPFKDVERTKLGVWFFLAGEVVLFSALISAYLFVRIVSASWPAVGQLASLESGALMTFILLTSSLTVVVSLAALRAGNQLMFRVGLLSTLVLGVGFLFVKGMEWRELFGHGVTFGSGVPETAFLTTTGVHGAHVAAGLVALVYIIVKAFRGRYTKTDQSTVENFGLYWHFVDIVWVFLFPLFYLI